MNFARAFKDHIMINAKSLDYFMRSAGVWAIFKQTLFPEVCRKLTYHEWVSKSSESVIMSFAKTEAQSSSVTVFNFAYISFVGLRRFMKNRMFTKSHYFKIANSIVYLISVFMVNQFTRVKFSLEMLFHNKPVFENCFPINVNFFVTLWCKIVSNFVFSFRRAVSFVEFVVFGTISKTSVFLRAVLNCTKSVFYIHPDNIHHTSNCVFH